MRIDTYPTTTQQELLFRMDQLLTKHPALKVYALVDAAFHPECLPALETLAQRLRSLMAHIPGAIKEHSPLLIALPEQRESAIQTLLQLTDGRPMLSFLFSELPFDDLADQWARFTLVTLVPEGEHFILRIADTRILANLIPGLTSVQSQQLFQSLHTLWYFNREAKLQFVNGVGNNVQQAVNNGLSMGSDQLERLLEASESDNVIRLLKDAGVAPDVPPSKWHTQVTTWIKAAKAEHLTSAMEHATYCQEQLTHE